MNKNNYPYTRGFTPNNLNSGAGSRSSNNYLGK
jgi:hypothetical protein